jgi:translation elongation factor P/translation initiation factor 5A
MSRATGKEQAFFKIVLFAVDDGQKIVDGAMCDVWLNSNQAF